MSGKITIEELAQSLITYIDSKNPSSINGSKLVDGTVTETKLDTSVKGKLNKDTYTKTEVNTKIQTINTQINGVENTKADKNDNRLKTSAKEIVPSINELYDKINGQDGFRKNLIQNIINNPALISNNYILLANGFYAEKDMPPLFYKCVAINNTENFANLGNNVFIGQDCSIKIDSSKKLIPLSKDELHISQLGGISDNTAIANQICINVILKNYITCLLGSGTYTIKGSIILQANSKLIGLGLDVTSIKLGDNVNQYPIKSHNANFNSFTILSNNITLENFMLDGNAKYNGVRNYTGNVYQTYWGFGMMLCNISTLNIKNIRCTNTEAWGISYWLCNTVNAENLEFWQDETREGWNGDGITGSAKRISINNVKGFTNDDMVAVTTGSASLRSNDCGVSTNIDIDYVDISNIQSLTKNNIKPYTGVGIYLDKSKIISKVKIENVRGEFKSNAISIADYWATDNLVNTRIVNCFIKNVSGEHSNRGAIYVTSTEISHLFISDVIENAVTTDNLAVVELDKAKITGIILDNIASVRWTSCNTINVLKCTNGTTINNLKMNSCMLDDKGGNAKTIYLINGGTISRIALGNIDVGRTYTGTLINIQNTNTNLICDKLDLPSSYFVPFSGTTINYIKGKIIGNSLNITVDAKVNVTNLNTNYDVINLSKIPFLLEKTYMSSVNLGGQPANECKPLFGFVYDNTSKKITLQSPSLNGTPTTGVLRFFAQLIIPLL